MKNSRQGINLNLVVRVDIAEKSDILANLKCYILIKVRVLLRSNLMPLKFRYLPLMVYLH